MLYLKLYNGRHCPSQDTTDNGFDGPEIGPLDSIRGVRTSHILLSFTHQADVVKFGINSSLPAIAFEGGRLIHRMPGGDFAWYGGWSVYAKEDGK
jgi:hypothetical protein